MKHPRFRVRDVLSLDVEARREVFEMIRAAVETLPIRTSDIELCGSYALGCARLHSDVDFNLAMVSEEGQREARAILESAAGARCRGILTEFTGRTGLRAEVGAINWRSRENSTVYSLRDGRMFGRDGARPILCSQRWNPTEGRFARFPLRDVRAEWDGDPWAGEVARWRERYGARLVEAIERRILVGDETRTIVVAA